MGTPEKGYFDEDDGTTLDLVKVRAGVEREMACGFQMASTMNLARRPLEVFLSSPC